MLTFLWLLCCVILSCAAWIVMKKIILIQRYAAKLYQKSLPEKKPNVTQGSAEREQAAEAAVDEYEQQLFDDIAALFFQNAHEAHSAEAALLLQADVLRRMPVNSKTQIRHLDLDEHSIYWSFFDQSLEYYMGQYGVFYTHVDRFGAEHKKEIRHALS